MRRQILGEKAIDGSRSNQKEDSFAKKQPEHKTGCKKDKAFGFAQGFHSLTAIENPNRSEIQDVEPSGRAS